ncbi:MAG: hypothetical protein PGMFKBFP_01136 [Anaerolineales bacterium]|nr:hypothetical protein [Anaerolineales bacterium]
MFAHAEVEVASLRGLFLEVGQAVNAGVVRGGQVGGAAQQFRDDRRQRVDDLARGGARRHAFRVRGEDGQEFRPAFRQDARQPAFQFHAFVGIGLFVRAEFFVPFRFQFVAALDGLAVEIQHVVGDVEARLLGPVEILFGGVQFLVAQRLAVGFGRPLFFRRAETDDGAAHNDGRTRVGFGGADGGVYRLHVVSVRHVLDVPAVGFEAFAAVFGEGQIGGAVNRDVVVVVKIDEFAELEMSRQRCGFGGDALHQIAVGDDGVDEVVEQFGGVDRREVRGGDGHAHAGGESLPERTGGHFHAGSQSVFGMAGRAAAPLTEVLQLVEREAVAGEMQERVEQHRTVSARKEEAVASRPFGVVRVVAQVTRPDDEGHGGRAHRQSGMSRIGLLDRVGGEETDGVDGSGFEVVSGHGRLFFFIIFIGSNKSRLAFLTKKI